MSIIKPASNPFYFKLAMVLVSIICLGYLSIIGKEILCPLIFSLLFAIVLLPMAVFFEKKCRLPRSAAAGISVIIFILVIAAILYLVGAQLSRLYSDLPMFKAQLASSMETIRIWFSDTFNLDVSKPMDLFDSSPGKILNYGTSILGSTFITVSSVMLFLVFTMFDTFFLLLYRRLILKFLVGVFREENSAALYDVVEKIQSIIRKYIVGLLLEMAIVAGVCCLAFWLLGIKYAILLGLVTGLFNIIPYIGIFSALLLSTLITFATGATAGKILIVVIVVVVMHLVDSNVLLPLVVGSKVRINALITLLGVIIGEMIWGIPGMFLAIPVIAMTKTIFDRVDGLQPWGILLGAEKETPDISDNEKTIKTHTIDAIDTKEHIVKTKGETPGKIETLGKKNL